MLSAASRRFAPRGAPEAPAERERQRQGERGKVSRSGPEGPRERQEGRDSAQAKQAGERDGELG